MAKFKPQGARPRDKKAAETASKPKTAGLISCLVLILGGILLFSMFFYSFLKSAK